MADRPPKKKIQNSTIFEIRVALPKPNLGTKKMKVVPKIRFQLRVARATLS